MRDPTGRPPPRRRLVSGRLVLACRVSGMESSLAAQLVALILMRMRLPAPAPYPLDKEASREIAVAARHQHRAFHTAAVKGMRATRGEAAADRQVNRVRRLAVEQTIFGAVSAFLRASESR